MHGHQLQKWGVLDLIYNESIRHVMCLRHSKHVAISCDSCVQEPLVVIHVSKIVAEGDSKINHVPL